MDTTEAIDPVSAEIIDDQQLATAYSDGFTVTVHHDTTGRIVKRVPYPVGAPQAAEVTTLYVGDAARGQTDGTIRLVIQSDLAAFVEPGLTRIRTSLLREGTFHDP